MSDSIANEIFENNSTLFQELNVLDVPTLNVKVTELEEQLILVNEQLVTLGRIVDTNQGVNNERYLVIQTQLDTIEIELRTLTSSITQLDQSLANVNNEIGVLDTKISTIQNQVSVLQGQVASINTTLITTQNSLTSLTQRVTTLETSTNSISQRVSTLEGQNLVTRVTTVEGTLAGTGAVPLSYTELYYSSAYVAPAIFYRVIILPVGQTYGNHELIIDAPPNRASITMTRLLTGRYRGVTCNFWFNWREDPDPINNPDNRSLQMVPIGADLRLRISTGVYTGVYIVRVVKQVIRS